MTQQIIFKGDVYQHETGMQLLDYVLPSKGFKEAGKKEQDVATSLITEALNVWDEEPYHLHVYLKFENVHYRLKVFKGEARQEDAELTPQNHGAVTLGKKAKSKGAKK